MPVRFAAAVAVALVVLSTAACTSSVTGQPVAAALAPGSTGPGLAVIPARAVPGSAAYPAVVDPNTASVLVGKPGAKVRITLYEDYLCPVCRQFDAKFSAAMAKQFGAGTIQVRYYPLNLLDGSSNPPGYSMLAANTALAVATAAPAKFLDFQNSLFNDQPPESGPGWTEAELKNLAVRLGAGGAEFDALVNGRTYDRQIQANLTAASNDPALQAQVSGTSAFGTPTVVAGGTRIDWSTNPGWLDDLVNR